MLREIVCCLVLLTLLASFDAQATDDKPVSEIAFVSNRDGNREIYLMNADGSNQHNLTNNPANDVFPSWSPDGNSIAFTSDRDGHDDIYTIDPNGNNLLRITKNLGAWMSTWSPDGNSIATFGNVADSKDSADSLYIVDVNNFHIRKLVIAPYSYLSPPSWSPDSNQIIFFSHQYGFGHDGQEAWKTILVSVADTNSIISDLYSEVPFWSPDGKHITFGDCGIFLADTDLLKWDLVSPSYPFKVSNDNFICMVPEFWSPNGQQIAFSVYFRGYNEDHQAGLYIMDSDGKNVRRIASKDIIYDARWSPDGTQIAYVSEKQIYVVEIETGIEIQLTTNPGDNENPIWHP